MQIIPLTQNQIALVDDEDFDLVARYSWCAHWKKNISNFYAVTSIRNQDGSRGQKTMHSIIMNTPNGMETDHILRQCTLDNRRENLRICTCSENQLNSMRIQRAEGSGGVYWRKDCNKWAARISLNGARIFLGLFQSKDLASAVLDKHAK